MQRPNPYQPPRAASEALPPERLAERRSRWGLAVLALASAAGVAVGALILAPFCIGPADPFGHSTGAGVGGFAGLGVGVLLRSLMLLA